ncbi:MAG TPA: hypothetical protein DCP63_06970 [Bacteroidetes bacterium]|nr:hypothetical protein [Bacteroidota bacterium]
MTVQTMTAIASLLIVVADGCSNRERMAGHPSSTPGREADAVTVQPVEEIDQIKLDSLIQRRKGKVLLLNVWATWCAPCVEEFPDLVRLDRAYESDHVEVVGISVDFPDEIESKIVPFLKKQNVSFKVFVVSFDNRDKFINSLDEKWSGAIPATFVYDEKGNRSFSLIGQATYGRFQQEIEKAKGAVEGDKKN